MNPFSWTPGSFHAATGDGRSERSCDSAAKKTISKQDNASAGSVLYGCPAAPIRNVTNQLARLLYDQLKKRS